MRISLLLASVLAFSWANEASAARFIAASISVDGKVILEGSHADRGTVDADGVWDYLKVVKFKPTKEFTNMMVGANASKLELKGSESVGREGTIVVDIRYGGRAHVRELKIVRVAKDKRGHEWKLDAKQVDEMFDRRYVRRSHVTRLKNPKATRK